MKLLQTVLVQSKKNYDGFEVAICMECVIAFALREGLQSGKKAACYDEMILYLAPRLRKSMRIEEFWLKVRHSMNFKQIHKLVSFFSVWKAGRGEGLEFLFFSFQLSYSWMRLGCLIGSTTSRKALHTILCQADDTPPGRRSARWRDRALLLILSFSRFQMNLHSQLI